MREREKMLNTPMYVFDATELKRNYSRMKGLIKDTSIYYTLKANSNYKVISVLKDFCDGFEVSSKGEYDILKKFDLREKNIICSLPIKPLEWIEYLNSYGCNYFVFDSCEELYKIVNFAPTSKKILRLSVTDISEKSIEFGMQYEEIINRISDYKFNNLIDGLTFHISDNNDIEIFNRTFDRIESICKRMVRNDIIINIGGGYRLNAPDEFYDNLNMRLSKLRSVKNVRFIAEPGNDIVNSAGKVYTKVIGKKTNVNGYVDLYIDYGKPSGFKTDSKRVPSTVINLSQKQISNIDGKKYRFIDITCMHKPHFNKFLNFDIAVGDILEFGDMGAYTLCLRSDFHAWEAPYVEIVNAYASNVELKSKF